MGDGKTIQASRTSHPANREMSRKNPKQFFVVFVFVCFVICTIFFFFLFFLKFLSYVPFFKRCPGLLLSVNNNDNNN